MGNATSTLTRQDVSDYIRLIQDIFENVPDERQKHDNVETILRLLWTTAYNKGCRRASDPY